MDLFRILICVAFVALLWRIEIRGVRPVRDFFLWGVDYPFHFLLTTTLILVIWGVAGVHFGLQGLFLDEDPLTQVLLGATVMLLFAAITVHYVALGTSRRAWWGSLQRLATFLRGVGAVSDPQHAPVGTLANGFLERLSLADVEAIDRAAREGLAASRDGSRSEAGPRVAALDDAPFRLLVAPAVLVEKGFILILLVGVVPAIVVPLLRRDPAGCVERLPWLVGVCVGHVLATILGCRTTAWAADAAGWEPAKEAVLANLRGRSADVALDPGVVGARSGFTPWWVTWLFWFFVVHALATFLPSDATVSRWIDWPERTLVGGPGGGITDWLASFPWLPLAVLAGEAALATIATGLVGVIPRWLGAERRESFARGRQRVVSAAVTLVERALALPGLRATATFAAVLFGIASVLTTILASPEASRSVWLGLRGYASLGAMLACWLGVFWLATHAARGSAPRTAEDSCGAAVVLAGLLLLAVLGAPAAVVAVLAATIAVVSGSRTLDAVWPGPDAGRMRPVLAIDLGLVAAGTLLAGWATGRMPLVAGIWTGLTTLFLGSTALVDTARQRPALLYPLTVLIGSAAFAFPFAVLDERWQSAMPAAGSIACIAALVTAGYTILTLVRPRSALLTITAILAAVMLLNGAALFVAPNEFKGTFPHMDSYYALPVYLDSRDYFRETTPSTSRLRNRAVTEDFDRLSRQGSSDRLATVFFRVSPLETRADGGHAIILEIEDPRRRIRAAAGDGIRLAAEEWFTIVADGDDLIALAEEPFYRKIFPWFQYGAVHVIRDGIIRGPMHPLVKEGEAGRTPRPGGPSSTAYRLVTRDAPAPGMAPDVMGLRLIGLQPAYRAVGGEYALISLAWTGYVAAVRREDAHDFYRIEFHLPAGADPLDESQLRTMQSWLERCHVDPLRPAVSAARIDEGAARLTLARADGGKDGDCVMLEDARGDAPVPVGVFLAGAAPAADEHPAFMPHRLTAAAVAKAISAPPAPRGGEPPTSTVERFTLRPAHDRGVFGCPAAPAARQRTGDPGSIELALYNAVRVRLGDRLILHWSGDGTDVGAERPQGAVFEVTSLAGPAPRGACQGCPPGAAWVALRPVDGPAAPVPMPSADGEFVVGQWQLAQLLNNTEVLQAWKAVVGRRWRDAKPKLVIVTLSGGGIRASVWTAVVLRKLEAVLGSDFPYHIRLVTGASGGMVAGSYYTTSLAPPPPQVLAGGRASFTDLHGTTLDEFVERMATDQLDAVAGRMLFGDVPGAIVPLRRSVDRGRTLEATWVRWTGGRSSPLGRPLQSYAADERLGWRPSLVYTPMMVEDGRRLLISNLDLAFATRNVGGLLVEPSSRKIERPTIQAGDFDLSIHEEDDVFSLSAVEFFRLFPRSHDFRVTTAIRMSASFPWVSPAVNLPTLPPRRVVDAAYYDNYGVNLSALWLSKMTDWLEENTSGVLVVQVRDKVSQGARTEIDFDRVGPDDAPLDRLLWHCGSKVLRPGLQAVTTPLIGVTNARQWTMAFRNDEQVDLQDLLFDDKIGHDFFRTVVFECPVDVSLSWKLTEREKAILTGGFGRPEATPREELSRVLDFMTGQDSYEFHKWKIEHRNDRTFQADLKERYDEQLRKLGVVGTERLTGRESQNLYENVIKNLKRLEILADWWNAERVGPALPPWHPPAVR